VSGQLARARSDEVVAERYSADVFLPGTWTEPSGNVMQANIKLKRKGGDFFRSLQSNIIANKCRGLATPLKL
jgi:hypothetical protein